MRFRNYLIFLIPILILACFIPNDNIIENTSRTNSISWILLTWWILFTIYFLDRLKTAQEYHSSFNSAFYLSGSLCMALIYSIWGNYTTLLDQPISMPNSLYFNFWILIGTLFYLVFGFILLIVTFRRYYTIYLFRIMIDARKYGIVTCIFNLIIGFITIIDPTIFFEILEIDPEPITENVNIGILLNIILSIILLIYGIVNRRTTVSSLNSDRVSNRIHDMDRRISASNPTIHPTREVSERDRQHQRLLQQREEARRNQVQREAQRQESAQREAEKRRQQQVRQHQINQTNKPKALATPVAGRIADSDLAKIRPKGGTLSDDDFKCIFCFSVPKLPADKNRNIVICPRCHYPAHVDEFRNWTRNSPFCSRCEGELPANYRTNPPVVSTEYFLKAMKQLLKK